MLLRGSSAAFRWRRAELVSCSMTSDRVEAVYYDGMELTSTLTGDLLDFNSSKEFRFRHSQGAYLAITVRGDTGVCGRDAFHISCTNGVNSEGWEVFGSTGVVDATHRQGGGSGWTAPCASSWPATPGVRGVWAEGATEATFRWLDLESWELALKAEWEDGTFDYDSAVWHDGSKSTFGTGAALQNTKTEAYSQLKLTRVKLVIDRMAAIFTLPVDVRYRYTLQELSSALSSSVFRAALSQMGLEAETPGWSSGAVDHFRLGNAQHYCGAGFDLRNGPSVRLGVMLGDAGCTTLTGVEGLGLSASSDSLGSGLLGSQKAWGRVEVYVEGSPLREQELRLSEISEGRVEIFRSGRWGTVDDSAFDNLDAQVICRQLSFNGGMTLPTDEVLQSAQNGKAMANTSCVGYEPSLADCVSDAVEDAGGSDAGVRCLRKKVLEVLWVGCYVDDAFHDLDYGPQAYGYTTSTCAEACQDFTYMALQSGWCSCGDSFATSASYTSVGVEECGSLCAGEELLQPPRYCGSDWRNAIYSLKKGNFQPGLLAEFYTFNQGCTFQDLTYRTPDESRVDANINYEATRNAWPGFSFTDHFAARWNGYVLLEAAGSHTFELDSDDGSRMFLEGVQVIDHDGCRVTDQATLPKQYTKQMRAGHYAIRLEHFENTWEAKMIFGLDGAVAVPSQLRSWPGLVIPGIRADFFAFQQSCSFQDLDERIPDASRVDSHVDYGGYGNDTHAMPWRGLPFANDFAARWSGYLLITTAGSYTFQVEAADCHRLLVDEVYLVDRPGCHPLEINNGSIALMQGFHRVTLEYFERSGASSVRLSYMGPDSLEMQVVPPEVWWSSAGTLQVGTNTKFYVTTQSCSSFTDLTDLIPDVLRFDSEINYASTTSAWTGLSFADHFAVSWTGFIIITLPGLYTFQVGAGVRTMRAIESPWVKQT
ncbi:unnamed protein product [Effrenium voratum]|nr:unnamed protein product [Effrenium voratum]